MDEQVNKPKYRYKSGTQKRKEKRKELEDFKSIGNIQNYFVRLVSVAQLSTENVAGSALSQSVLVAEHSTENVAASASSQTVLVTEHSTENVAANATVSLQKCNIYEPPCKQKQQDETNYSPGPDCGA